jgi:nucleoside 2-deoxyribosyltransferase
MTAPARSRIYLAGPEVFLPNAAEVGRAKCRLCEAAGFVGLFPLDAALELGGLSKLEQARRISAANEALIRSADLLIANLTPFRGVSVDSGTAFEVGFMRSLRRPVLGYTNVTADYRERSEAYRSHSARPRDCDRADVAIEDFGLAENLMIEIAIKETGGEVARHAVPPGRELDDLQGLVVCLAQARRLISAAS